MKTRIFASILLVAVLSSGCAHDAEMNVSKDGYRTEILQAIVRDDLPFTRLTQTEDGAPRIFENSDNIAVLAYSKTNSETVRYITGQSLGAGKFIIQIPNDFERDYYSIYPYAWSDINNYRHDDLKVTIPTEYDYENVKDQKLAIGMVAINDKDRNTFEFSAICGCLRLTVTGVPAGTGVISVAFDKCITGSFLVEEPWDIPAIKLDATAAPQQVLIFLSDKTTADNSSFTVNIPMPVGTYATIVGKACDVNDNWDAPTTELATGSAAFTETFAPGNLKEFTLALSAVSSNPISTVTTTPMDVVTIDIQDGNHNNTWN